MYFIIVLLILFIPSLASAQPALLPACAESGNCGFCDIVDVISRGFEFVLYFLGATIFFVFIWGAFELIIARGKSEKVEHGKNEMKGALFGLLFVLIAWHVINVTVYILTTPSNQPLNAIKGPDERGGVLFANPWNWLCAEGAIAGLPASQQQCFSRGDGTPCGVDQICMKGECGTDTTYTTTCQYLKGTYPDKFSGYDCKRTKENVDNFNKTELEKKRNAEQTGDPVYNTKFIDCLPDPSFCGFVNTTNFCCGEVKESENPYKNKGTSPADSIPVGNELSV
ncbi:MAG: hypothetical protein UW39_C0014G0025 [Parcubacteria group bacterium GW2011_GWC2_44_17]|uniref:Uncharacterized protein n=1 Tax=Candidatus Jacksonbacteria bacterium RIFCSPLOWO2_02_FULL_44_20 TaxID=1798460 RepID=A0A1G2A9D6_9BACT|nr:MAG: hypothetical protein UW39_C0014G0025 [Parcubacteria group bacterium GW2011_GWC2_44_17]KKT50650.1 MAG: hypothetical protein UW40_C0001G0025 [Parcubacteria group bacterium GW2011_GWF2_44_17]OGY71834.1 MAG: hypothetical protein A3C00_01425 [Candidatus Jacksonbacteria bacterium RIFCSPHIGHO2_02_FULL_44_25]OGY73086.1 MAG: hypothetical protein A3H61_02655 [Candidatus Jacksonbacteria bacterium RIFCSPLOWO2_02_FULL_44_20]HCE86769.1 hypothetical protein [Candidatus Jacksonbacteria bacterium]